MILYHSSGSFFDRTRPLPVSHSHRSAQQQQRILPTLAVLSTMLAASYLPVSTLVPKLNTKSSPSNSFSSDSSTDSTTENPLGPSKCNPERTGAEDEEALAERFGRILGLVGNEEVEVERERTESEEIESREFWGAMNRARRVYSGQSALSSSCRVCEC